MPGFDPLALIDACYAAAVEPETWSDALDGIADAVGARGAVIVSHDPARTAQTLASERIADVNLDYGVGGWWQHDTRIRLGRERGIMRPGTVTVDEMYLTAEEKRADPFFQHFIDRHRLANLCAYVGADPMDRHTLSFSASRDVRKGPFEGAEIERMGFVGPHVIRAFRLTALVGEMRREAEGLTSALERMRAGIVVLDVRGRVRLVSPVAERLAAGYLALRTGAEPEAAEPVDGARFGRFLADVLPERSWPRQETILLRRRGGGRPLYVEALPLRGADPFPVAGAGLGGGVVLLLRDLLAPSTRPIEPLLEQLGLTRAEARVAALVGRGAAPREVAEQLAVGESTVRSQLKAVYGKLAIRRQSELAVFITRLDSL
ncbi:LuxR family transcriptional regulator [Methylorubrum extorquens]|nr:LuxR family transcriptional regulator [Methylorubrum extorquens]